MAGTKSLRKGAYGALVEACRRYTRFHNGCPISKAWTGLGTASAYKQAADAGLMEIATSPNLGHNTWWRLTERGAGIVLAWIGAGFNYEKIETGNLPPIPAIDVGPSTCGATSCYRE